MARLTVKKLKNIIKDLPDNASVEISYYISDDEYVKLKNVTGWVIKDDLFSIAVEKTNGEESQ